MINRIYIVICCIIVFLGSCYKEEIIPVPSVNQDLTLSINEVNCAYDKNTHTFFYAVSSDTLNDFEPWIAYSFKGLSLKLNDQVLINNSKNILGELIINKNYELVTTNNGVEVGQYYLLFTLLPTIEIFVDEKIVDEPKHGSYFRINDPRHIEHFNIKQQFESYAGIEIRGGTSQNYPKKSYAIELWDEIEQEAILDYPLLGMRDDDDWILDAMYIDEARMRNIVSFRIWKSMVQPENSTIDGEFVELFINNDYQGVYCLTERIDSKQLNLDDNINGEGGFLYKAEKWGNGVPTFYNYSDPSSSSVWSGWHQIYPDPDILIQWAPLYDLIKFVVDSPDEEFKEYISSYIDMQSFINYYIFINIISGFDNVGKNTFLYKKTISDKFKIAPWDMDGTWGRNWDASLSDATSILTNNLYLRLMETNAGGFKEGCRQQWISLRLNIISLSTLCPYFQENRDLFIRNNCINRENERWNVSLDINTEYNYIESWTTERLEFLDDYFENL